jgi:adenosylhomocysteinase
MKLEQFFETTAYVAEKEDDLHIMGQVIERFTAERPLEGARVVVGHLIVLNSITMIEALYRGGAQVALCSAFPTQSMDALSEELTRHGLPILPAEKAVLQGDIFMDTAGFLGSHGTPRAAVEVTRTGEYVYDQADFPVITIDQARIKLFEDFLGTGESFVRGWEMFRPQDPLPGKCAVQFGYGKVGSGVAYHLRKEGVQVVIADLSPEALQRAAQDGFEVLEAARTPEMQAALAVAEVVIGVTGIRSAVGETVPAEWLRANNPVLAAMGYHEFGDEFTEEELLGGADVPVNFHLVQPTLNRYMDATLAAQVLAVEELVKHTGEYRHGLTPLPKEIDDWLWNSWIELWPEEDLSGVELRTA